MIDLDLNQIINVRGYIKQHDTVFMKNNIKVALIIENNSSIM